MGQLRYINIYFMNQEGFLRELWIDILSESMYNCINLSYLVQGDYCAYIYMDVTDLSRNSTLAIVGD